MIVITEAIVRRVHVCGSGHDHEYEVQYGIDARSAEPAHEILNKLKEMSWENKLLPKHPDDSQFSVYDKTVGIIEAIASGHEIFDHEFGYLQNGIWEIKHANVRITFYDTDGQGKIYTDDGERKGTNYQGYTVWYFPELDDIVRLGQYWEKLGRKAGDHNIIRATKFRSEDVGHDKGDSGRP